MASTIPVAMEVPTLVGSAQVGGQLGDPAEVGKLDLVGSAEGGAGDQRLAQLFALGSGAAKYVGEVNPLQGLHSMADASAKMRSEAKDLINPTGFSKPKDRAELMARVSANVSHFRLSYSGCYALTLVYFVLTSPFLLFELALIAALWVLFFKVNKADDVVAVGQYKLGKREKMLVLVPLTTFVAFFGGLLSSIIYIVFLGTAVVGTHASFRRQIEVDPLDALDAPTSHTPPAFV